MPDWFWKAIVGAIPLFGGLLLWWQSKPQEGEVRALRLRRSLRIQLRLRIVQAVAPLIPCRIEDDTDETFLARLSEILLPYLDNHQGEIADLKRCEDCYISYVRANRLFKWSLLIVSIIVSALIIASRMCYEHGWCGWGFSSLIVAAIAGIVVLVQFSRREVRNDRLNDLSAKYEVYEEQPSRN